MVFSNREDAGRQLANQLTAYSNLENVVVLGLPRGGVPVAFEVASRLHVSLDIFLSGKLGVPGHQELAFGAVALDDGRFLDQEIIRMAGISEEQIEHITRLTRDKLGQRAALYRGGRAPLPVAGKIVILVDDGIATGASIYAAIWALRQMKPKKLVVAVPVAPSSTCEWLRQLVDELVVTYVPNQFYAVGQFYDHFSQVSDTEVISLLRQADDLLVKETSSSDCTEAEVCVHPEAGCPQRELEIPIGEVILKGSLGLPKNPKGIVLFAHGSGSSRHSPRNRYVAGVLQSQGLATLLFDLLTHDEEAFDRRTGALRFDIEFLADRLIRATQWVMRNPDLRELPVSYFGASTGAAAALVAAARLRGRIAAVVSRGGRPDLAGSDLANVDAPTLLIVGGLDEMVIALNRQALSRLSCSDKNIVIIQGATHLFEEAGTLEQVAQVTAEWLVRYRAQPGSDRKNRIVDLADAIS
jgi:putative phosphoribosyl transferase